MSREAVLAAAKERFATEGYEKTTLRAIADDAHVDPSMVLYLFGSKAELFRESLRLLLDPDLLVAALKGTPDANQISAPGWCGPTCASGRRPSRVRPWW